MEEDGLHAADQTPDDGAGARRIPGAAVHQPRRRWSSRSSAACFAIFGHGNVAGIGQALLQAKDRLRVYLPRNEQAMVHTAVGFAKMANRRRALACTSSIGPGRDEHADRRGAGDDQPPAGAAAAGRHLRDARPGAGAAAARVCRRSQDVSVNDCFKPVSRYWDRINRPEQLITALPEALRVLTSPAETGAVTLCLPQDVQAEAFDYPEALFRKRVWTIARPRPDRALLEQAAALLRAAKTPLIIAGGGAIYSEATDTLARFAGATGIAVVETMAGKGALRVRSSAGARRRRRHRRARREPAGA